MNTQTWLSLLKQQSEKYPEKQIQFWHNGQNLSADYHITEVKANHWQSIDCGKQRSAGEEAIVQLLTTADNEKLSPTSQPLSIKKILHILDAAQQNFVLPTILKFEYQPNGSALSLFQIQHLGTTKNFLKFELLPLSTACKPKLPGQQSRSQQSPSQQSQQPSCCSTATATTGSTCC